MPLHSISFSIPAEIIVEAVPLKSKLLSAIIPGHAYAYDDELDYYCEYQRSGFARTSKKLGWDCLRHYEILANGCVPLFSQSDSVPQGTMVDFPWGLIAEGSRLAEIGDYGSDRYQQLVRELLDYTARRLTTVARARQILLASGHSNAESVLFLSGDPYPDYLRCLTLHGFKMLLGTGCIDACRIPHIYADFPREQVVNCYGRGFTYTRRVPTAYDSEWRRIELESQIRNHRFDVVIYGSVHRGQPFWEEVRESYSASEILLLCGEDIHHCDRIGLGENYHLFIRELGSSAVPLGTKN